MIKTSQDYDAENDDKDNDMDAKIDVTSQEELSVRCVEFGVVYRAREADIVGTKSFWQIRLLVAFFDRYNVSSESS